MKRAGIFFAIIFVLSSVVYAQTHTITVTLNQYGDHQSGILEFGPLGIRQQCWFDESTPIRRGTTYEAAATYMNTKSDSVTGNARPGIFLRIPGRQIFIHEGTSVAWSEGCIVIPRNVMLRLHEYLYTRGEPYNIRVVVR